MARERLDDREAGRPERGLFTGRGPRRSRQQSSGTSLDDARDDEGDDERDDEQLDERDTRRERKRGRKFAQSGPRTGAKRTVMQAVRQIPSYIRLLLGLMADSRVARLDKFLVVAAVAYIVSPLDFIPDFVPFLGEVDDIFLMVLALQRLVENSGRRVLLDHWRGDPDEISDVNLAGMVSAAGFFLPGGLRRRLMRMARRKLDSD